MSSSLMFSSNNLTTEKLSIISVVDIKEEHVITEIKIFYTNPTSLRSRLSSFKNIISTRKEDGVLVSLHNKLKAKENEQTDDVRSKKKRKDKKKSSKNTFEERPKTNGVFKRNKKEVKGIQNESNMGLLQSKESKNDTTIITTLDESPSIKSRGKVSRDESKNQLPTSELSKNQESRNDRTNDKITTPVTSLNVTQGTLIDIPTNTTTKHIVNNTINSNELLDKSKVSESKNIKDNNSQKSPLQSQDKDTTKSMPPSEKFVEEVVYITVQENIVSEKYEDGTTITKTIITEIAEETPFKHDTVITEIAKETPYKHDTKKTIENEIPSVVINNKVNVTVTSAEPTKIDSGIEMEIDKFAEDFTMSVLNKAVDSSINVYEEKPVLFDSKKNNILDENKEKRPPRSMSRYKLFILQKYAERLIGRILSDSLPKSQVKANKIPTKYATDLAASIFRDVINEYESSGKQNLLSSDDSPSETVSFDVTAKTIANKILNNGIVEMKNKLNDKSSIELYATNLVDIAMKNNLNFTVANDSKEKQDSTVVAMTINNNDDKTDFTADILDLISNDLKEIEKRQHSTIEDKKNGTAACEDELDGEDSQGANDSKTPVLTITNGINKPTTLVLTDGGMKVGIDVNQNDISQDQKNFLRPKRGVVSDRPLSGYAEKLAELLAEEDDFEFDSDEDMSESLQKIKNNFGPQRRISVEIHNIQEQYSAEQLNDYKGSDFKSKVRLRQEERGRRRLKGDRPMSLYAQDMLADLLGDDDEEFIDSDGDDKEDDKESDESNDDDDGDDSETDNDDYEDEDVVEDEIQPVSETVVLLENQIPLKFKKVSICFDYDAIMNDELMRTNHTIAKSPTSSGKPPVLRQAAVIDAGCGILKAGICGEVKPSCYCPSVIGVPRRFSQDVSKMKKAYYVGDEAWSVAGMLQIEHPIKQNINNWSDVTSIMEHLLEYELHINDNEHPLMLTEMSLSTNKHREKITEIMFERFGIPAFYLANQSCLAMYSKGLVSGISLNSGFYHTHATPIYEGHAIPHATQQLDLGGDHVTSYLGRRIMSTQGALFNSSSEKLVLNSMKQGLCYVALDTNEEHEKYKNNSDMFEMFTLPDGQEIELGTERFIAPEILFDPNMMGIRNQPTVAELIPRSLQCMDVELNPLMSNNILVSGGNSKIDGFGARLEKELTKLSTDSLPMTVKYADDPILSTWIGGSILASIAGYRDQWISMEQYAEQGARVVRSMCF